MKPQRETRNTRIDKDLAERLEAIRDDEWDTDNRVSFSDILNRVAWRGLEASAAKQQRRK